MITRRILPIPMGVLPGSYAVAINMSLDENYVLSAQLVDQNGNTMGTAQTVDLPLEAVIVDGRYDDQTQSLILVLDNGNEITIPISGLISGLQEEITTENPLSADLLTDGTNNKVFTAAEQTKLSGIAAGAEVNVQANWNESDSSSDSYIQNKPDLSVYAQLAGNNTFTGNNTFNNIEVYDPDLQADSLSISSGSIYMPGETGPGGQDTGLWLQNNSIGIIEHGIGDLSLSSGYIGMNAAGGGNITIEAGRGKITIDGNDVVTEDQLATVATTGSYNDLSNKPTLATVATTGSYNDLSNKPTLGTMAAENASDYTPTSSLSSVALSGSYTDLSNTPDLSVYAQLAEDNTFTGTNTFNDVTIDTDGINLQLPEKEEQGTTYNGQYNVRQDDYFIGSEANIDTTQNGDPVRYTSISWQVDDGQAGLSIGRNDVENNEDKGSGLSESDIYVYHTDYDGGAYTINEVLLHPDEIVLHTLENDGQGGEDVETVYVTINQGGIEVNDGSITIDGNSVVTSDILATVATTGDYDDLSNKPTIPTVNDATITLQDGNGTALGSFTTNDANNQTITIPAGGGGNEWFGTQAQFDALSSYDADTDYFISDKIDYNTDVVNKPNLSVYATQSSLNQTNVDVAKKMEGKFLTEQEFTDLQNKSEGVNYFIEGTTIQMEVTFSDQTTATYNVVID